MVNVANTVQNTTVEKQKISHRSKRRKVSLRAAFWFLAILLGAIQAWASRFYIFSEDGISYLDIADAYFRGDWKAAINGNWSPLYSWIIGAFTSVLKPNAYWEFPTVKLVNFLIYVFTLGSFEFLLSEVINFYQIKVLQAAPKRDFLIPEWVWIVWGYLLFIWSSLRWIGVNSDTPDMLTAALIYLAAGIVLRVHTKSDGWHNFIILGLVLGLGYLSKSVMFPLTFVFLPVAMFSVGKLRRAVPRTLAAFLIFALVVTPFITALSIQKGRPTIGEAGKLSYAWYISPEVRDHYWEGIPPSTGTAKHPPRRIFNNPRVYEFGTPLNGTYPVWYDPSYWNDGLKPKFNLTSQIKASVSNLQHYFNLFLAPLIFGYLILISFSGRVLLCLKELKESWRLLIPAVAGLTIYLLVTDLQHLKPYESRYLAPFVMLLFAGILSSVRLPSTEEVKRFMAGMTLGLLLVFGGKFSNQLIGDFASVFQPGEHIYWQVAEGLKQLGVQPGDKVAHLGYKDYYWARLAKVKIVAEIPQPEKFWEQDDLTRAKVLQALKETGAKVLVQEPGLKLPKTEAATGWKKLGKLKSYAYLLQNR